MKVLFAVSNESVSESIVKKYQQMYKEIILSKNVYYFNAILKELQKDKTYDRIVISEDLEPFTNNNYETIDNFIFEKLDSISDEAATTAGEDIPIILIATDRRTKSDNLLIKLFGIGVYSTLLGQDRSIEEVCKLIQKPRSKKEAKMYYKIDSNDVEYKPENEGDVSETEIQNILTHYKRLGKNEERYVESFDNIAAQYTDAQLKVIIRCLPLNVKVVLEENSTRYQQLMSFGGNKTVKLNDYQAANRKRKNNTNKAVSNNGIKVESIPSGERKITKPVIIPSANNVIRKVEPIEKEEILPDIEQFEEFEKVEPIIEQEQTKKRRGRPKKVQPEVQEVVEEPKKKRGRPRKNPLPDYEEKAETLLPGFDEIEEDDVLPGFEMVEETLPGFEDFEDEEDSTLPGFEDFEDEEDSTLPGFDTREETILPDWDEEDDDDSYIPQNDTREIEQYQKQNYSIENLLTSDKKIVSFVGTPKNGTSFLVNNLAENLSNQGIKTAILDLTKNRNAYYIYTKNEEQLRNIAYNCIENLANGMAKGIKVNNNLDVYTSLPGENNDIEEYQTILQTLVENYSLVLLDCDFNTNYNYLKQSQEIYLVQSMDVLTIQPLTEYLRDLKAKGILEQNKLKVIINKYTRVRGVTEKAIIGGMAFYNDPAMSFMTELFNREVVPYCVIPFDMQVYSKYLEGLVNCNISFNGYSKEFIASLKKLSDMVYPLVGNNLNNRAKYTNPKYNKFASNNTFSNDMNSTLDKMKRNY